MSASAERLTLPEPAAELWNRTGKAIRESLAEIGASKYQIGGGTILAARWERHRRSYDLDLSVEQDVPVFVLRNRRLSRFAERMAAAGGSLLPQRASGLISVQFDNPDGSAQGIDIWAHPLPMPGAEGEARIAGRSERVLSTAQILWGKLARGDKNIARDVYDVVKAAEKDPTSLEVAVNAHQREWAEHVALGWYWHGRAIADSAAEVIDGIPPAERQQLADLGIRGTRTIKAACYATLEIRRQGDELIIRSETANGTPRRRTASGDAARELCAREGLNRQRISDGPPMDQVIAYALEACRQQTSERELIYREEKGHATAWKTRTQAMNVDLGNGPAQRPTRASETGQERKGIVQEHGERDGGGSYNR